MQPIASRPEELFLKLLKSALVILMGLALLGAIGLSVFAGIKYSSKPIEPAPAMAPPNLEIKADPLVVALERLFAKKDDKGSTTEVPPPDKKTQSIDERRQQFMNYARPIYACSKEFAKAIGQDVFGVTAEDDQLRVEVLADSLVASDRRNNLGSDWGPALVTFTCDTLRNPRLIELKKKHAGASVLVPLLDYHREQWMENKKMKQDFINSEEARVNNERRREEQRVAEERAQGWFLLGLAAAMLGAFSLLALYLIFARIEINLRVIAKAVIARESAMPQEPVL